MSAQAAKESGERTDSRRYYQSQPGCEEAIHAGAIWQIAGANALVHAPTGEFGNELFLFQMRAGGFYGAIGGAIDIFVDDKTNKVVSFEPYQETLSREFLEETGHELLEKPSVWQFVDFVISQVDYRRYPSVHGASLYFAIPTTAKRIHQYASGGGSKEGKIVILNTQQVIQALKDGKVFPNTEPALRKLLQDWYLLPQEE